MLPYGQRIAHPLSALMFLAMGFLGPPRVAAAQTDYTITTKILPAEHLGACPVKASFVATITANKAGPVKFQLHTSDNAYDPVREMMFTAPGTKSFAVDRNLPPPGSGWGSFEIVGPVNVSGEEAYYTIECTNDPRDQPVTRSTAPPRGRAVRQQTSAPEGRPSLRTPQAGERTAQHAGKPEVLIPKSDLVITAVTGSHYQGGTPGHLTWKFLVEVTNEGPVEAGGGFLCAHEDVAKAPSASKNPIPKLGSNQSATIEYFYGKPTWWFVENGQRKKRPLIFLADCLGSVAESSESNNQYSIWLYWDPTETKTWEPAQ